MDKHAANLILANTGSGLSKPPSLTVAKALLVSEETFATVLFLLAMDHYGEPDPQAPEEGPMLFTWSAENIRRQLERDFGVKVPKVTLDKIMAAVTIVTTNYFFKDVQRFIELCNILAGDDFQPDEFDPASADEILWGVTESVLLYPPAEREPEDTEFSPEVRGYIQEVLKLEGIINPPDVLRLGGGDMMQRVQTDFADDPEMFQAIWESAQGQQAELLSMVRDNLAALAQQLTILPLEHGSTGEFVQQIQKVLATQQGA